MKRDNELQRKEGEPSLDYATDIPSAQFERTLRTYVAYHGRGRYMYNVAPNRYALATFADLPSWARRWYAYERKHRMHPSGVPLPSRAERAFNQAERARGMASPDSALPEVIDFSYSRSPLTGQPPVVRYLQRLAPAQFARAIDRAIETAVALPAGSPATEKRAALHAAIMP